MIPAQEKDLISINISKNKRLFYEKKYIDLHKRKIIKNANQIYNSYISDNCKYSDLCVNFKILEMACALSV